MNRFLLVGLLATVLVAGSGHASAQEPSPPVSASAAAPDVPPPPPPPEITADDLHVPPVPQPPPQAWPSKPERHPRWDHAQSQPSAQDMQEILELLKEQDPPLAQRLEAIRQTDPQRAQRMLGPHVPGLMRLAYLKRTDPEHFRLRMQDLKLDRQSRELARQIHGLAAADMAAQRDRLTQELRAVLAQQFQVRQQLQEKMVQDLQQRLENLRLEVERRRAQKDQLIDQRFQELLQQNQGPQW